MTGNLMINDILDSTTLMGCTSLGNTKTFSIPLGNLNNQLFYNRNDTTPAPITFLTSYGCLFELGNVNILRIGQYEYEYL